MKSMLSIGAFISSHRFSNSFIPRSSSSYTTIKSLTTTKMTSKGITALYSSSVSKSSSSSDNKESALSKSILGGDFAGQSATFSGIDGKLIPVPEYYVPESMIEWGQIPR